MGGAIGLVAIIGGVLIALALAYAWVANRRRSAGARARTEQATHDLFRQDGADDTPRPRA